MLVARSAVRSLRVSAPVRVSVGKAYALSTSALRPTTPLQLQATQPSHITTPVLLGGGLIGACVDGTYPSGLLAMMMRPTSTTGGKWVKGGFQSKMDRKEAIQILGLRYVARPNPSEASVNRNRIKDAHRRMMIANHPDRGGSPYLASSTCACSHRNQRGQGPARTHDFALGSSIVGIHVGIHQPQGTIHVATVHPRCHGTRGP